MSAHHLQDEGPLVAAGEKELQLERHGRSVMLLFSFCRSGRAGPLCRSGDGVHHLDDAVQGGVCADGHVSAAEIVVDGTHHAHDVQVGRRLCLLFSYPSCRGGDPSPQRIRTSR